MKTLLAIDQGTTGTTCLVVDAAGRVLGRGYRELAQSYPAPGLVEHDALEILATVRAAAREAVAAAGVTPTAIGITNQRETVVLWERATGRPVHPALVWQDRRTSARCAELAPRAAWIGERTGLVVDPYFSATKLEWLLGRDDLRARAERGELAAGTIDAWLVWHLTGGRVHATEPTNASRTMLYDLDARAWSDELCALFGVPRAVLPEVRPSLGDFGTASPAMLGFAAPILGIAGDQQAALFGQGGWDVGVAKNTYGTGAFLLRNCGATRPAGGGGLLTTLACGPTGEPLYALEASIFVAGAAVQWLRDGLGIVATAAESEALARSVPSTDGVYFVPALTGLGAPDWEPHARGTIVGLTRGTTRAHLARAALEAMAYATADVLDAMRAASADGAGDGAPLRVDGGATTNEWLVQFQADVLGAVVERPAVVESTALGAAGLAGIAAGVWPDAPSFLASRRFARFAPGEGSAAAQAGRAGWRRAVRAALAWARDDKA
ncbi:glycerol kinase GlpK [Roseisolibacter sp. H3M3-2]|uniref:FGGY family carbohydrate kinase n=1 Tax=Roseisolibacter sp. H3M3-2 TaxID=3031323 RepID=UPI0023DC579E|nr:glycerol kinase GlpK [Roseisolibacter sp. H3M3-2]MDF1503202.1 glycerol kinase GlpK [Roseisolibacter sp. H3M3-2]